MKNKQKAWRTEAAKINARRAEGSREPKARIAKEQTVKWAKYPSFLLVSLLMGVGLWPTLEQTPVPKPVGTSLWARFKKLFS